MSRVAGSNFVAVKSALVAALTARPGLAGVQVAYSTPARLEGRSIYFDDARPTDQLFDIRAMTGVSSPSNPHLVREELQIPLTIQVHGEATVQAADTVALGLLVEVQQALAEASQVATSAMWVQLSGEQIWSGTNDQMRPVCRLDLVVSAMSELYPD